MKSSRQQRISGRRYKKKFISLLVFCILLFSSGFLVGIKYFSNELVQASDNFKNKNINTNINNISKTMADKKAENTTNDSTSSEIKLTGDKEVYLTFDDGPSKKVTPQILEILDEYNVKASFFIIGKSAKTYPDLVKEENASGHAVCNHTYSHNYEYLYSSPSNFIKDVEKCNDVLQSILGNKTNNIIRFPGGGFYKKRAAYRELAKDKKYKYIDWHVETGDARANHVPVDKLLSNLKEEMNRCSEKNKKHVVVLMHDLGTKQTTADALPQVIEYFKSLGYTFRTLENYPFQS
ncbi:polysaccharide deacetylase family protein [Clostridium sp. ZS2-4]|uniref:polysaccharide deacetylase family protein n=1 Tax=Clostridium sp. ZS2-4 TaxID=2987703 RepID=UPI00227A990A|nr:polysaccharide deacetylase family protein [Clostridium sp. ZS2-4]MCY6355569.1 polysaccharide deacetylase [Clostridium sp. ZS2-4]